PFAIVRTRLALHSRDELHGPGCGRLVHAPRHPAAHLPGHQSAAVLPDRLLMATRSDPRAGASRRSYLPGRFRDRRHRSRWAAGRKPLERGARLARPLATRHWLLRARSHFGAPRQTEAREWLATATHVSLHSAFSSQRPAPADISCGPPGRLR